MKKTCLTFVLIYVGAAAAVSVGAFLWDPTPPGAQDGELSVMQVRLDAAVTIGGVTAIPLTLAIACLIGIATTMKEWRLVAASLSGSPLEDGRRMAAVGTLRALAPPLQAPLSRRECTIYHYEIRFPPPPNSKFSDTLGYWGHGMAPCQIDSLAGSVRLLAYADLDFPPEEQGPAGLPNAVHHLEATSSSSTEIDVLGGSGLREFQQLLADDDGRISGDFRLVAPQASLEGCRFQERVIRHGDELCAFGYYSSARGGFVPLPGCPEIFPIRIVKGAPREVARRLRNTAIQSGFGAVLFLAFTVGALLVARYMARG